MRQEQVSVLVFEFRRGDRFVTIADRIVAFGGSGAGEADRSDSRDTHSMVGLEPYLGIESAESDDDQAHLLKAGAAGKAVVFSTMAQLRFGELRRKAFYRLPWLLHQTVCPHWIRGLALLDSPGTKTSASSDLAVWVDLSLLAGSISEEQTDVPTA